MTEKSRKALLTTLPGHFDCCPRDLGEFLHEMFFFNCTALVKTQLHCCVDVYGWSYVRNTLCEKPQRNTETNLRNRELLYAPDKVLGS